MATQIEFHGEKLTLNGKSLKGNTFPIKDAIKKELGGRWNPDAKVWEVDIAKALAFAVAAPAPAPAPAPAAAPAARRPNDEAWLETDTEGKLALAERPRGHDLYRVEVVMDADEGRTMSYDDIVACPRGYPTPPTSIRHEDRKAAYKACLVWSPGWVPGLWVE